MTRRFLGACAGLCIVLTACPDDGAGASCDPGELVCDENRQYVCDSATLKWVLVDDCVAQGLACVAGRCVNLTLKDDKGQPLDTTDATELGQDQGQDQGHDQEQGQDAADLHDQETLVLDDGPDLAPEPDPVPEPAPDPAPDPGPVPDPDPASDPDPEPVPDPDPEPAPDPEPDLPPPDDAPADPGPAAVCGDGKVGPGEDCDDWNLGGGSCTKLGYGFGTLACRPDCHFDTLLCGEQSHSLAYDKVQNILVQGDFVDVAWHPEGKYAVLAGRSGAMVRYDPALPSNEALSLIGKASNLYLSRVAFAPSGDAFVVGYVPDDTKVEGHVLKVPDGAAAFEELPGAKESARFVSIRFSLDGKYALIAGQTKQYSINYLCVLDPAAGTTSGFQGYNASAGVSDLAFITPSVAEGLEEALLTHGWNGVDAKVWIAKTKTVMGTGNLGGYGNMGRCAWRPGGKYGVVAGTSSSVLYVYGYDGFGLSWSKAYLDNQDIGSSVFEVAFRPDGKRALVLGNAWNGVLHVLEHRPKGEDFSGTDFLPQPISPWDKANPRMLAAAFRPGVPCDEGLMVGEDNGGSLNPTWGIVMHFRDTDPYDCPP